MTAATWIGGASSRWPVVPIRRVCRLGTGHTPDRTKPEYWEDCNVPWVTVADIHGLDGSGLAPLMDTEQKVSELGLANSAAVLHPTETVMVSRTASIGFACRIGRPMATTQAFIAWTPGPEVDSRYLLLVVKAMKSEFDRLAHGSTHLTIYMPDIEGLKMPLPPLETQRAIADTLDVETSRLDALIDKKRRMVRLLEESFSSWVFAEVTGREAGQQQPSTLAWVDWIPSAWRSVPLRYAARLGTGHTPSRTHPEYWVDCNVPWISLFDVGAMRDPFTEVTSTTKQRISDLGLANSSAVLHAAGTVVLSRTASVGFATIMGNAMAVSQHFVTWTCGEDLLPEYLLYVLRAMRQEWESLQVGTTNVTVFMPDLYAVRIPLPPLMEQEQIVARIRRRRESVRQLVSALESQVSLLVEHRQAIITAAVTGEIDVPWAAA